MIEKMKVVYIVSSASHKTEMLDAIRKLGLVHVSEKKNPDRATSDRFATLSKTSLLLKEYADKKEKPSTEILSDKDFEVMYREVLAADEKKKSLQQERSNAVTEMDRIHAWGDFIPADVLKLKENGLDLHFYRLGKKEYARLAADENTKYISLAPVDKMNTVAVLGTIPEEIPATEFKLPEKGLTELQSVIDSCDAGMKECDAVFKKNSVYLASFNDQMLKAQNAEEYSAVSATVENEDQFVWLRGYIPTVDMDKFKETAAREKWAWASEDPADDDDKVPTKVRYNKFTRIISPVFDILGTLPGYREFDISFWFLCFFTLFFAMIVGDAAYGCLFLIAAIVFNIKLKKTTDAISLLYVMSIATIIWGALTGTWFGMESAMKVPFLKALVIPTFANYPEYFNVSTTVQQNSVMKFCFIIGAVQISLACVMCIKKKLPQKDLSWVADFGWLCAVCALYFMVLYLVIGEQINLIPVAAVVIFAFILVVLFGGMSPDKTFAQGLKAGLANAFTVFLNTISCFGNVMSYIRLFAVGMASLAISQSFNNMASSFHGVLIVVAMLIVLLGHSLNIVMALLSVVVHGVRLNLLEFSGQLGMEWTGIAYEPFKKNEKIKK